MTIQRFLTICFLLLAITSFAMASVITPDFSGVPTGWVTDRFQPNGFTVDPAFQGRTDVLNIDINSAQGYGSRPSGFNSTFYNTQGMQYAFSSVPGVGSILAADLWVDPLWESELNGSRRTDMWGVMVDGSNTITEYPIVGFTNYDGTGTGSGLFRAWDQDAGGWVNLSNAVLYGNWNSLEILFTGTTYEYRINGALAYTDATINGSTGVSAQIMQAYNFRGDPSLTAVTAGALGDYQAHWDNAVPEPVSLSLVGGGLLGLMLLRKRRERKLQAAIDARNCPQ